MKDRVLSLVVTLTALQGFAQCVPNPLYQDSVFGVWPDTVEGLRRLKTRYIIGTLSNGNVGLLTRMAKHAGLPWDVVLGSETARAYKPLPQAYLASAELLNLAPGRVMLVAAHNGDLAAAASCGLRTAFVARPTEYGPHQKVDFKADREWDVAADSFTGVADQMGC